MEVAVVATEDEVRTPFVVRVAVVAVEDGGPVTKKVFFNVASCNKKS